MNDKGIDPAAVAQALAGLGVSPGDAVAVHSRVPALGRVTLNLCKQGRDALVSGVHKLIDGFCLAVGGQQGIVMVPTFSYCFVGRPDTPPWNPRKSVSHVGMLTDEFWRRPDAVRSNSPTHSVAAIGGGAAAITAGHDKRTPLGADTPFHRLARRKGWICYLGTNGKTLSLLHVAEVLAGVPYVEVFCWAHLGWQCAARIERPDGSVETAPVGQCPGCSNSFGRFDEEAEKEGLFRKGKLYDADLALFSAAGAMELAIDRIRREPDFFLCRPGACPACDVRRQVL